MSCEHRHWSETLRQCKQCDYSDKNLALEPALSRPNPAYEGYMRAFEIAREPSLWYDVIWPLFQAIHWLLCWECRRERAQKKFPTARVIRQ